MLDRRKFFTGAAAAAALRPISGFAAQLQMPPLKNGINVPVDQFKETIIQMSRENGGRVVIFDVGAAWCGFCVVLAPQLDIAISEFRSIASLGWVRTDVGDRGQYPWFEKEWKVNDGLPRIGAYYKGKFVPGSVSIGAPEDSDAELKTRLENWVYRIMDEVHYPRPAPPNRSNPRTVEPRGLTS